MRVEKNTLLPRTLWTFIMVSVILLFIKGSIVVLFEDVPIYVNGIQVEVVNGH